MRKFIQGLKDGWDAVKEERAMKRWIKEMDKSLDDSEEAIEQLKVGIKELEERIEEVQKDMTAYNEDNMGGKE